MTEHHITVTTGPVGGAIGRAWFDCACGVTVLRGSAKAANQAAMAHHRDVIGCTCTPERYDPDCIARTVDPDIVTKEKSA